MIRPRGPLGFVVGVIGLWMVGRSGAVLWPIPAPARTAAERTAVVARAPMQVLLQPRRPHRLDPGGSHGLVPPRFGSRPPSAVFAAQSPAVGSAPIHPTTSVAPGDAAEPGASPQYGGAIPVSDARPNRAARLSGSAWALVRDGSAPVLATGGQLGGSQAGLRLRYALTPSGFALFARVSAPIEQRRGKEAALGIEWQPLAALPVRLAAERRIALDRGGRDAFGFGAFGGVDQVELPARFRLDAYAQAGVVGFRSRDAYVDGSVRIERALLAEGRFSMAAGAGVWGAAQPGASRLDVGPQLVLRVPLAGRTLRLNLDWRQRVAGDARPGSGAALTLASDF